MEANVQGITAYEEVPYPGFPFPQTHPDRLCATALLLGLDPAPVDSCRVLELGCGDGGNLIPMALAVPGGRFIGIDAAGPAIARGRQTAELLGIENVELQARDFSALSAELGEFDYVIAHGVYSWVPPELREALLAGCRRHLARDGIAYVSYSTYPGAHLRDISYGMLRFHLCGVSKASERIRGARELLDLIVTADPKGKRGALLRTEAERLLELPDWQLLHDAAAEINEPVYFFEFAAHAARHGLRFLAEADVSDSGWPLLPPEVISAFEGMAADLVAREQYVDFVRTRMFRQTLLCHASVEPSATFQARAVRRMAVASRLIADVDGEVPLSRGVPVGFSLPGGGAFTTEEPILKAGLVCLAEASPRPLAFDELATMASALIHQPRSVQQEGLLAEALLRLHLAGFVELFAHMTGISPRPGVRPVASPLARLQASHDAEYLTTLRHTPVLVDDEFARRLLVLLDGHRDRAALLNELGGVTPRRLEDALGELGRLALLSA